MSPPCCPLSPLNKSGGGMGQGCREHPNLQHPLCAPYHGCLYMGEEC